MIKDWVLPLVGAGVGLFLEIAFNWRPIAAVKHVFEGIGAVGASFFGSHAATKGSQMLYGFAGPIIGFWLGFFAPKPLRRLLDRIPGLRDPPPFTRIDLDAEEDRPFRHSGWTKPAFIGRHEEKAELVGWAVEPGPPFRWRGLIGRSGTGKTRLALHWLAEMDERGWDAGLVDPEHPIAERWRARRPTALVVDEAQLFWDKRLGKTLDALYAGASEKAPLRILVLNMTEPTLESRDSEHIRIVQAMRTASLRLTPFDEETSRTLWRAATEAQPDLAEREFEAAGLPNAIIRTAHGALEGRPTSYQAELTENVIKMMPKLADNAQPVLDVADRAELKIVAFAAMAGPLDWKTARDAHGEFGRRDLRPILPDADLDLGIPVITPEDLRLELLLRCLALLGEHDSLATIQAAIRANPNAVEVTLGSLWADRPESPAALELYNNPRAVIHDHAVLERAACVVRMQRLFDDLEPDRGSRAVAEAGELSVLLGTSGLTVAELARIIGNLDDIIDRRPFDPAIRREEAKAASTRSLATAGQASGRRWSAGESASETWSEPNPSTATPRSGSKRPRRRSTRSPTTAGPASGGRWSAGESASETWSEPNPSTATPRSGSERPTRRPTRSMATAGPAGVRRNDIGGLFGLPAARDGSRSTMRFNRSPGIVAWAFWSKGSEAGLTGVTACRRSNPTAALRARLCEVATI
jgi:hypothetical protein